MAKFPDQKRVNMNDGFICIQCGGSLGWFEVRICDECAQAELERERLGQEKANAIGGELRGGL